MHHSPETPRALAACVEIASEHGLDTSQARVVRDLTNVVVDFAPAPVIGRVSMSLGRVRGPEWIETEVAFASYASRMGASVASPTVVPPSGPHERDGFLVTFWERVPHDRGWPLDHAAAGRSLRRLHQAISDLDLGLPSFDRLDEVDRLLEQMQPADIVTRADIDIVRRAAAVARERVSSLAAPARPLHGDAHFGNVLRTEQGPVWTDFENVCTGPIEYDLACLVFRERVHGHDSASGALAAYGSFDAELLELLLPVLGVFLTTWTIEIGRRRGVGTTAFLAERIDYMRQVVG